MPNPNPVNIQNYVHRAERAIRRMDGTTNDAGYAKEALEAVVEALSDLVRWAMDADADIRRLK